MPDRVNHRRHRAHVHPSGDSATLVLDRPLGQRLEPGAPLLARFHGPEGLLLLREHPEATGALSGTLSTLSIGELLGVLVGGLRSGRLHLQSPSGARRTVVLRDGQVVFATSSERHERLGPVLVQLGMVTQEQLQEALGELAPGERVGQVLVRLGLLTPAGLYSAMTFLVREVFLNLFEHEQGDFLFLEGGAPPEDALKLAERTRDLVLLGLKRAEALARLRQRLPPDARLTAGARAPEPHEAPLVSQVLAGPLETARLSYDGSELAFLTEVAALLDGGVVAPPAAVAPGALTPVYGAHGPAPFTATERYAALIRAICAALLEAGQDLAPLRHFLSAPTEGLEDVLAGVTLSDEGELDVDRVLGNVRSGGPALARAMALEALDAFASFALFSAKNALPPERAAALDARFRAIQAEGT